MTTYLPGDFATLVTDQGVVLAPGERLADVAALGDRDLDALTVVEVLSRGALSDLPDFAAVQLDGTCVRILARGAFEVRVDGFAVTGVGAPTWHEASAPLTAGSVVVLGPLGGNPTGVALPLSAGVVRSGAVVWTPEFPAALPDEFTSVRPPAPVAASPAPPPPVAAPAPVAGPVSAPVAAPVAPPAPPTALPVDPPTALLESTDHDGHTITAAQLQALRNEQATPAHRPPPAPPARPRVALGFSTGRVVPVRRRVLIGRSPRVQQVGGSANLPALVTIDDPYVSGTHLEVSSDGTRVTVTDTSTNGTLLSRQGRLPIPLDPGVATEVVVGDVLTLSKGLTATVIPAPEPVS